jgi:ssDNA-binding Zn-finger/Zn-ribbon topoisomerase 1
MSLSFDKEAIMSTITDGMKMKAQMLKKGVTSARVKCPKCDGMLHARLAGRKSHIRFWCDGPCKRQMME